MLDWGAHADQIRSAAVSAGRPIPDTAIPPEIPEGAYSYVSAFWQLSTCRTVGPSGVPGPIPWTAIDQMAVRKGLLPYEDLYDEFVHVMGVLDESFVKATNKKAAMNQEAAKMKKK